MAQTSLVIITFREDNSIIEPKQFNLSDTRWRIHDEITSALKDVCEDPEVSRYVAYIDYSMNISVREKAIVKTDIFFRQVMTLTDMAVTSIEEK